MAKIPLIMPQLGESIAEATIVALPFSVGDTVEEDQDVIEVETNKATMSVTSPCRGRIAEILVEVQQSYPVGATLGFLDVDDAEAARLGLDSVSDVAAGTSGSAETSDSNHRRSSSTKSGGV